jgi:CheY-like chemotaxis protein
MSKHIIIADDEADVIETAQLRLEASGYKVSTTCGEHTVDDIRKQKPDLIILDVMMPGMDGFAIVRELKRDPELSKIPVLIFSGKPKTAMMELFGPEGIAGYISKPYDPPELLSEIKRIIGS